jgi:hypothetical protein
LLQVLQSATADSVEESQLVSDLFQSRIPFEASILIGNHNLGALLAGPEPRDESGNELVWDKSDNNGHGQRNHAEYQGNAPLVTQQRFDRESLPAHEDDQDLTSDDDELNTNKPTIAENAFEDVQTVVNSTSAMNRQ